MIQLILIAVLVLFLFPGLRRRVLGFVGTLGYGAIILVLFFVLVISLTH